MCPQFGVICFVQLTRFTVSERHEPIVNRYWCFVKIIYAKFQSFNLIFNIHPFYRLACSVNMCGLYLWPFLSHTILLLQVENRYKQTSLWNTCSTTSQITTQFFFLYNAYCFSLETTSRSNKTLFSTYFTKYFDEFTYSGVTKINFIICKHKLILE